MDTRPASANTASASQSAPLNSASKLATQYQTLTDSVTNELLLITVMSDCFNNYFQEPENKVSKDTINQLRVNYERLLAKIKSMTIEQLTVSFANMNMHPEAKEFMLCLKEHKDLISKMIKVVPFPITAAYYDKLQIPYYKVLKDKIAALKNQLGALNELEKNGQEFRHEHLSAISKTEAAIRELHQQIHDISYKYKAIIGALTSSIRKNTNVTAMEAQISALQKALTAVESIADYAAFNQIYTEMQDPVKVKNLDDEDEIKKLIALHKKEIEIATQYRINALKLVDKFSQYKKTATNDFFAPLNLEVSPTLALLQAYTSAAHAYFKEGVDAKRVMEKFRIDCFKFEGNTISNDTDKIERLLKESKLDALVLAINACFSEMQKQKFINSKSEELLINELTKIEKYGFYIIGKKPYRVLHLTPFPEPVKDAQAFVNTIISTINAVNQTHAELKNAEQDVQESYDKLKQAMINKTQDALERKISDTLQAILKQREWWRLQGIAMLGMGTKTPFRIGNMIEDLGNGHVVNDHKAFLKDLIYTSEHPSPSSLGFFASIKKSCPAALSVYTMLQTYGAIIPCKGLADLQRIKQIENELRQFRENQKQPGAPLAAGLAM